MSVVKQIDLTSEEMSIIRTSLRVDLLNKKEALETMKKIKNEVGIDVYTESITVIEKLLDKLEKEGIYKRTNI